MGSYHEALVEVGSEHVVDELLPLVFVFGTAGLVLEDDIVVPAASVSI